MSCSRLGEWLRLERKKEWDIIWAREGQYLPCIGSENYEPPSFVFPSQEIWGSVTWRKKYICPPSDSAGFFGQNSCLSKIVCLCNAIFCFVPPVMYLSVKWPLHKKINPGRNWGQFPQVHFNAAGSSALWHSQKSKKREARQTKEQHRAVPVGRLSSWNAFIWNKDESPEVLREVGAGRRSFWNGHTFFLSNCSQLINRGAAFVFSFAEVKQILKKICCKCWGSHNNAPCTQGERNTKRRHPFAAKFVCSWWHWQTAPVTFAQPVWATAVTQEQLEKDCAVRCFAEINLWGKGGRFLPQSNTESFSLQHPLKPGWPGWDAIGGIFTEDTRAARQGTRKRNALHPIPTEINIKVL